MTLSPEVLTADADMAAAFSAFDVLPARDAAPWFTIDDQGQPRQFARNGSGGAFVLLPTLNVLYVSSDGRAGIIADSFEAFVALIVACPYWTEVLKFSAGGDLGEMRRAAEILEEELEDPDEVEAARRTIRDRLGLSPSGDAIGQLYEAVAASEVVVRAPDGTPLTTLFNRFSLDGDSD